MGGEGWYNFFITNLVPVTLGNIVGGGTVCGCAVLVCLSERTAVRYEEQVEDEEEKAAWIWQ